MWSKDIDASISYLKYLSDKKGITQFSKKNIKELDSGYAVEDQARALVLSILIKDRKLIKIFYDAVSGTFGERGQIRVWKNRDGKFGDIFEKDTEAAAQVFWALSTYIMRISGHKSEKIFVGEKLNLLKEQLFNTGWIRVKAYFLLGLCEFRKKLELREIAEELISIYRKNSTDNWHWFEKKLTYANALIPWSLISAYEVTGDKKYLEVGLSSLNFLLDNLIYDGKPVAVGNKGWWKKGAKINLFDQQPIDISYMVIALVKAYQVTSEEIYRQKAGFYFSWFFGNNVKGVRVVRDNGGCFDGLCRNGVNLNLGAESTICYLLASVYMMTSETLSTV